MEAKERRNTVLFHTLVKSSLLLVGITFLLNASLISAATNDRSPVTNALTSRASPLADRNGALPLDDGAIEPPLALPVRSRPSLAEMCAVNETQLLLGNTALRAIFRNYTSKEDAPATLISYEKFLQMLLELGLTPVRDSKSVTPVRDNHHGHGGNHDHGDGHGHGNHEDHHHDDKHHGHGHGTHGEFLLITVLCTFYICFAK